MSELSPSGADSYQARRILLLAGFVLLLAACATSEKPKNWKRTQPDEEGPPREAKPVETRRLGRGEVHLDSDVREPTPMSGRVIITTWANDVIRGRLVEETADGYVLDTSPDPESSEAPKPKLQKVPRAAVMEMKPDRRAP